MFVAMTDYEWYRLLRELDPEEVNFWQPRSTNRFRALTPGGLFLFKLHAPRNYIVGGGVFTRQSILPASLAWDAFGMSNGRRSQPEFLEAIYRLRQSNRSIEPDPVISSLILTEPFFFEEKDWFNPPNWSSNIVQGKGYTTEEQDGLLLYEMVQRRLWSSRIGEEMAQERYGKPHLIAPRLGQGAFRVVVTEAYHRRCAITGERTLPVLHASHIRPYSLNGPHQASNGVLLRQDIHTLFDRGYITINEDQIIEVSRRIKEDYGNGKEYYSFHGKPLPNLPDLITERPSPEFLRWHNENAYVG